MVHRPVDTELLTNIHDQIAKEQQREKKLQEIAAKKLKENEDSGASGGGQVRESEMETSPSVSHQASGPNLTITEVIPEAMDETETTADVGVCRNYH